MSEVNVVKWLGSNIEEDSTHRLVTDEQIERWDKGAKPIEITDENWKELIGCEVTYDCLPINPTIKKYGVRNCQ